MNAIKKVRSYLIDHANSESAGILADLVVALARDDRYSVGELFSLDRDAFDLALELLRDWRVDRYYAARLNLLDQVLHGTFAQSRSESSA